MALSQMQVFNQYVMPATIETLAQRIALFNEASAGAIQLSTEGFDGDFYQRSFFAGLHSAQRRVDRYGANSPVSPVNLSQEKEVAVKVAGGFGPILFEPSQLTWLNKPTAEGIEVMSSNFAEALLRDQLNSAIAALVAATGANSDANFAPSDTDFGYGVINGAHALFGDRSLELVANVMSGAAYHALIAQNLANQNRLFTSQGVTVVDILGKVAVVTDAPALVTATSYRALGLTSGAAIVHDAGDVISNIETKNGNSRIETTMQVDYSFGLRLKGYAWDTTNGGRSPSDAALATGANWNQVSTSVKHTAGVLATGDIPGSGD